MVPLSSDPCQAQGKQVQTAQSNLNTLEQEAKQPGESTQVIRSLFQQISQARDTLAGALRALSQCEADPPLAGWPFPAVPEAILQPLTANVGISGPIHSTGAALITKNQTFGSGDTPLMEWTPVLEPSNRYDDQVVVAGWTISPEVSSVDTPSCIRLATTGSATSRLTRPSRCYSPPATTRPTPARQTARIISTQPRAPRGSG